MSASPEFTKTVRATFSACVRKHCSCSKSATARGASLTNSGLGPIAHMIGGLEERIRTRPAQTLLDLRIPRRLAHAGEPQGALDYAYGKRQVARAQERLA